LPAKRLCDESGRAGAENTMFFPLMADTWGDQEIEAIQGVIESGRYTMAGNVSPFRRCIFGRPGSWPGGGLWGLK